MGGLGIWGASRARGPPTGGLGPPALPTQLQPSAAWPRHLGPRQDHAGIKKTVLAMMKSGKSLKKIDAAIREMVSQSLPATDKRLYRIMRFEKGAQNKLGRTQRLGRAAREERRARLEHSSVKRSYEDKTFEGQPHRKKPTKNKPKEAAERGVEDDHGGGGF